MASGGIDLGGRCTGCSYGLGTLGRFPVGVTHTWRPNISTRGQSGNAVDFQSGQSWSGNREHSRSSDFDRLSAPDCRSGLGRRTTPLCIDHANRPAWRVYSRGPPISESYYPKVLRVSLPGSRSPGCHRALWILGAGHNDSSSGSAVRHCAHHESRIRIATVSPRCGESSMDKTQADGRGSRGGLWSSKLC